MNSAEQAMKPVRRAGLWQPLLVLLLGIFCLAVPATGRSQSSNRWLFVFNTSAAMRTRAQGIESVTADLLSTGMHGNMRPGDTIGIWTYDSQLRSDEAPLQFWKPEYQRSIIENTLGFLTRHRYAGPAAFDDVIANMLHVTKISDTITIILISDGSDPMKGTPFDASINAFYKTNYKAQKNTDMPVVTVFRGEGGKMTAFTDTLAPWPVDIPAVPEPKVVKASPPKPAPPEKPAAPVPSLVMIGKKSETVLHPLADYGGDSQTPPAAEQKPAAPPPTSPPATAPAPSPALEEKPKAEAATPVAQPPFAAAHSNAPAIVETPNAPESTPPATVQSTSKPEAKPATPAQPNVETALAPAPHDFFSTRNIAIVLAAFAVILCGLFLAARRSRRGSRASLITRSLDREQR